jgi:hypothetical protein
MFVLEQDIEKIRAKLSKVKTKVNKVDNMSRTALHYVAMEGLKEIFIEIFSIRSKESLGQKKWDIPDVNIRDVEGRTPLLLVGLYLYLCAAGVLTRGLANTCFLLQPGAHKQSHGRCEFAAAASIQPQPGRFQRQHGSPLCN